MRSLFIALLLLISSVASADELVINIASHHVNSVFDYNSNNIGLGYRWKHDNNARFLSESEIGFYRNSYYKTNADSANGSGYSVYIKTSIWTPYTSKYFTVNTDFGLAYYGRDGLMPLVPILQITGDLSITNNIIVKLGFTPLPVEVYNDKPDGTRETSTMLGILTLSASYSF